MNRRRGSDLESLRATLVTELDAMAARCPGDGLRYYGYIAEIRAMRDSSLVRRAVVDRMPQAGGLLLSVGESAHDGSTEVSQCA
jgi:hypothetical protein